MYKLNYDLFTGKALSIQYGNTAVLIGSDTDIFRDFLKWNNETVPPRLDLNSTTPVIVPGKPRDILKELDELKAQVAINTTKISTLTTK